MESYRELSNEAPCGKPQGISMEKIVSLVTAMTKRGVIAMTVEILWRATRYYQIKSTIGEEY